MLAGEATFQVPEFFETDISAETGFGDVIVADFQADSISDDRRLTNGDIGKGTGVYKDRLPFKGLHQVRVKSLDHPGGHGAVNL